MIAPQFVTIGVYGFDEEGFFRALTDARVDTFCDLRRRRGLRGSEYAFANSTRLQERLAALGVRYLHCLDLAPPVELRQRQAEADRAEKIAKRSRTELGEAFIQGYREACLDDFDSAAFIRTLGEHAARVALFCVERDAEACHRSLVAARLALDLGARVEHLLPGREART